MFLSKITIHSCIIIFYNVEKKNIFATIVYKLSVKKKRQKIIMCKEGEYFKFKNYESKIKIPFIIYADFESALVPEDNEKRNP